MRSASRTERIVMNIKPVDKTIRELLLSRNQFIIPRFQREYSWDKKNYSEFLEDMVKCLEINGGKISPTQYFIGTMLFVGDKDELQKQQQSMDVVDGQQRLTTITILFSALSDIFKIENEKLLSEQLFKYIMTTDDNGDPIRILKSKTHYPFFADYIQSSEKLELNDPSSEEEQCIKNTYDFFIEILAENKIRQLLQKDFGTADIDQCSYIDILKAIRDQVLNCTFVSIYTKNKNQANMIFEILNAKGKKLSSIDLIKNKIFELLDKKEPSDFATITWQEIKAILNDENCDVGFATFYRHFWLSRYKKSSDAKLYDDFVSKIKKNKEGYIEFLKQLLNDANLYAKIVNPQRQHFNNRKEYFGVVQSLNALSNTFNISQSRIVILALMNVKSKKLISLTDFKKCLYFIENFHLAYNAIGGLPTNRLESIYSKRAIALNNADNKIAVKMQISELKKSLSDIYISYPDFEEKFKLLTYTKKSVASNTRTKYVIQKINSYFEQSEIFSDDLSIEHISPETENANNINIGNLIALELAINKDADMLGYSKKRSVYKSSKYTWVNDFISKHKTWDQKDYNDRARDLARLYYQEILKK